MGQEASMNRTLRALIPVILVAAPSLRADTSVRFFGTVKTQDGKPIEGAKITLERLDIKWKVEMVSDAKGTFSRAGVTPLSGLQYQITITKDGYAQVQEKLELSLSNESGHHRDFVLLPPGAVTAGADVDPALKADSEARDAFNAAVPLYKNKQYAEALPNLEKAYKGMTTAAADMKDELAKADSQSLLPTISKIYGIDLHEVGRDDEALPLLTSVVDANPKNVKNADAMPTPVEIYTKKKDDANRLKYQAMLNAATGTTSAAAPYNDAVNSFNAGKFKEAKQHLEKAIASDPSFPDSYYLLGLVEMSQGNLAGAKSSLRKYIELAPNGKHAQEVKEALSGL